MILEIQKSEIKMKQNQFKTSSETINLKTKRQNKKSLKIKSN